jgi:DNA replication and repair protein RecF
VKPVREAAVSPNDPAAGAAAAAHARTRLWVERLILTGFRNYAALALELGPEPVVLAGANGSGKTNLIEAVSLLAPGQGLRRAPFPDLARAGGDGSWSVAARMHTALGAVDIGTGITGSTGNGERSGRIVRIDGEPQSGSGALADYVEMVWLTPASDGLFTGPASERRRFLDRLILCFDAAHAKLSGRFERAMQSRNRLLSDGVREAARFDGLERIMAESGTAIAAARNEAITALSGVIGQRRSREPDSPFPWCRIMVEGTLERDLMTSPAVDVEEAYVRTLAGARERDRAAGRTLDGPHRSDLVAGHGPKSMPAHLCSTGEQKALLLGLVLAHAELIASRQEGLSPILLLDEVTAHLDAHRREALFAELLHLGCQAWLTGTDSIAFAPLEGYARLFEVEDGKVMRR